MNNPKSRHTTLAFTLIIAVVFLFFSLPQMLTLVPNLPASVVTDLNQVKSASASGGATLLSIDPSYNCANTTVSSKVIECQYISTSVTNEEVIVALTQATNATSSSVTSIVDSSGICGGWTKRLPSGSTGTSFEYVCNFATLATNDQITATMSGKQTKLGIYVIAVEGANGFDSSFTNANTFTCTSSCDAAHGAISTTYTYTIVYAFIFYNSVHAPTPINGWITVQNGGGIAGSWQWTAQYQIFVTPQTSRQTGLTMNHNSAWGMVVDAMDGVYVAAVSTTPTNLVVNSTITQYNTVGESQQHKNWYFDGLYWEFWNGQPISGHGGGEYCENSRNGQQWSTTNTTWANGGTGGDFDTYYNATANMLFFYAAVGFNYYPAQEYANLIAFSTVGASTCADLSLVWETLVAMPANAHKTTSPSIGFDGAGNLWFGAQVNETNADTPSNYCAAHMSNPVYCFFHLVIYECNAPVSSNCGTSANYNLIEDYNTTIMLKLQYGFEQGQTSIGGGTYADYEAFYYGAVSQAPSPITIIECTTTPACNVENTAASIYNTAGGAAGNCLNIASTVYCVAPDTAGSAAPSQVVEGNTHLITCTAPCNTVPTDVVILANSSAYESTLGLTNGWMRSFMTTISTNGTKLFIGLAAYNQTTIAYIQSPNSGSTWSSPTLISNVENTTDSTGLVILSLSSNPRIFGQNVSFTWATDAGTPVGTAAITCEGPNGGSGDTCVPRFFVFSPATTYTFSINTICYLSCSTSGTFSLSGGSVNKSSVGWGTTNNVNALIGGSITITTPSGYIWNNSGTTYSFIPNPTGVTFYAIQQVTNTYQVQANAQTLFDNSMSWTVTGTIGNTSSSTVCLISSSSLNIVGCSGTSDFDQSVTIPKQATGPPAGSEWNSTSTCVNTPLSSSNVYTCQSWKQYHATYVIAAQAQSSFDSGLTLAVHGNQYGSNVAVCTITTSASATGLCTAYIDASSTPTYTQFLGGSVPAHSQWQNAAGTSSTGSAVSSGSSQTTVNYYKQWTNSFKIQTAGLVPAFTAGSGSGLTAAITGTYLGVSGTTLCSITVSSGTSATCGASPYSDNGAATLLPRYLSGALTFTQWQSSTGPLACSNTPVTGNNLYTCSYYLQDFSTFSVVANAQSNFDNLTWAVMGTYLGTGSYTLCTITVTSSASTGNCNGYSDYNQPTTIPQAATGSPTYSRWYSPSACVNTPTTGNNAYTCQSWKQWTNNFKFNSVGSGSASVFCNQYGVLDSLGLTSSYQALYCDNGFVAYATNPVTISATEQYTDNATTYTITAGNSNDIFTYSHQFYLTITQIPNGGGTVTITGGGSASEFITAGNVITVHVVQNGGFTFINFTGTGTSSYTGTSTTTNAITMNNGVTEKIFFSSGTTQFSINIQTVGGAPEMGQFGLSSLSPVSFGLTKDISASSGSIVTVTPPADQLTYRYRFNNTGSLSGGGACTITQCTFVVANQTFTFYYVYYQVSNTYVVAANAQTLFDTGISWAITGTSSGSSGSTICTISISSPVSTSNCAGFSDYNTLTTIPKQASSSPSGSEWNSTAACTQTPTTGGNTYPTCQSWKQYDATYVIGAHAQSLFDSGLTLTVQGNQYGTGVSLCLITTSASATGSCTAYIDASSTPTYAQFLGGAVPSNSQWQNVAGSSSTGAAVSSGTSQTTVAYYKQWSNSYKIQVTGLVPAFTAGSGSGLTAVVTGTYLGTSGITLCTITVSSGTSATCLLPAYSDNGAATSIPVYLTGNATYTQWQSSTGSACSNSPSSGGNLYSCSYYLQVVNSYTVVANAQSLFDNSMSWVVTGTYSGTGSSTICTISSLSSASVTCSGYSDYGQPVTIPQAASSPPSNSRWYSPSACINSPITGHNTYTCQSWKQWTNFFKYNAIGSGSSSVSCNQYGSIVSLVLTSSSQPLYCDNGYAVFATNPVTISSTEQYADNGTTYSIVTGGLIHTFAYTHQFYLSILNSPAAGGTINYNSGFFNSGNTITLIASPSSGNNFTSWTCTGSGCYSGPSLTTNPITLGVAITETANWSLLNFCGRSQLVPVNEVALVALPILVLLGIAVKMYGTNGFGSRAVIAILIMLLIIAIMFPIALNTFIALEPC